MIKKKILIFTLIFSLSLQGCTPKQQALNVVAPNSTSKASTSNILTTNSLSFSDPGYLLASSPYISTGKGLYEIKNIFPASASLFYYDYNSKKQMFLCEKPECTHDNDTCTSFVSLSAQEYFPPTLLFASNQLLLVKNLGSSNGNASIVAVAQNGGNRHTLIELGTNEIFARTFVSNGDFLFFIIETVSATHPSPNRLVKMNMHTGEITTIMEMPYKNLYLSGFNKTKFLFQKVDLTMAVYQLDPLNEPNLEEIVSWNVNATAGMTVNEYVYLLNRDNNELSLHNTETGEIQTFATNILKKEHELNFVYTYDKNLMLQTIIPKKTGGAVTETEFVDTTEQTVHPHTLRTNYGSKPLQVMGEYGDYLCVQKDIKENVWHTTNESGISEEVFDLVREYALISKADFKASIPSFIEFTLIN